MKKIDKPKNNLNERVRICYMRNSMNNYINFCSNYNTKICLAPYRDFCVYAQDIKWGRIGRVETLI